MPRDQFTGDGVTSVFTLSAAAVGEGVFAGGLLGRPGVNYTLVGKTLTFLPGSVPVNGEAVDVLYQEALPVQIAAPSATLDYTADSIITMVRDALYKGNSVRDWTDPQFLRLINRQIHEYLVPFIVRHRKEYFVTFQDQALIGGQASYLIPTGAHGQKLRFLQLVDANGMPYSKLVEAPLEKAASFGSSGLTGPFPQGLPQGIYFTGNKVVLVPIPSGNPALFLRAFFYQRPSALILKASALRITNLTGGGGAGAGKFRIGIGGVVPSGITTGASCDLVQNDPGFDVLFTGTVSAISAGTYIEFTGTLPPALGISDWISLTRTAPVITGMVAELLLGCLINKVAAEIEASKSDSDDFKARMELLRFSEREAKELLEQRRNAGDHAKGGTGSLYKFRRNSGSLGF